MRQQDFEFLKKVPREFGGSLLENKRKFKRTITADLPIHLVLKSDKARGEFSFINHQTKLQEKSFAISRRHGVRIYAWCINWDHIHFVIRLRHVNDYSNWIRELTKELVLVISKETKTKIKSFFTCRPYTRIITWGREFREVLDYLKLNEMEVAGIRPIMRRSRCKA